MAHSTSRPRWLEARSHTPPSVSASVHAPRPHAILIDPSPSPAGRPTSSSPRPASSRLPSPLPSPSGTASPCKNGPSPTAVAIVAEHCDNEKDSAAANDSAAASDREEGWHWHSHSHPHAPARGKRSLRRADAARWRDRDYQQHDSDPERDGSASRRSITALSTRSADQGRLRLAAFDTMASWTGQPRVKGSSETSRMVLLTCVSIGITFTWGVEMTYCTPYLLSLGLTKGQTSMVWIAGPLSGLIVQPIIGVTADESTSKWGRRRPVIAIGSVIVALSLLMLGFTKEIVAHFVSEQPTARLFTIILAVLSLYSVDFAINAVMSCARSLIVDTLPIHKQQVGAAWASRMGSLGHVVGYAMGAIDLVTMFGPGLGDTQFKQLTIIAALSMLATAGITCWAVTERVLVSVRHKPRGARQGLLRVFGQIWSTMQTMPPRVRAICWAVFWSWIGWFPFNIYGSTWVGETYFRFDVPAEARSSSDALGEMGRIGSMALTVYSTVTLLSAWILPPLIRAPDDRTFTRRPPAKIARWVEAINRHRPDLLTAWICSHFIFSASMLLTPFATSFRFATGLVAVCGFPWTIAIWAPTTFLGVEVNKLSAGAGAGGAGNASPASPTGPFHQASYRRLSNASAAAGREEGVELLRLEHSGHSRSSSLDEHGVASSSSAVGAGGELSGVYFGILNIYTTIPQFIGTFISTIVFAVLEPGKSPELATDAHPSEHHSTDGPNAIAICLVTGAFSAMAAAWATSRLRNIP